MYRLILFDSHKNDKATEFHLEYFIAYTSGENWRMLSEGNDYEVLEE